MNRGHTNGVFLPSRVPHYKRFSASVINAARAVANSSKWSKS
jgi:hypothetical protein